ncbi:MAG: CpaF family protein [Planctomycetes bacterium]|nr:CpaF family protein [Planctomycetota bacterium]
MNTSIPNLNGIPALRGRGSTSPEATQDLHTRLIAGLDLSRIGSMTDDEIRKDIRSAAEDLCNHSNSLLSAADRERLVNEVMDEAFGLGPIEPLLRDSSISDILVNGPNTVYVERGGKLELTGVRFVDEQHLLQIIQRIVGRVGRRVDETNPMVDARLADGSRVNAIIPPLALDGALLCIRRFSSRPLRAEDLIAKRSVVPEMIEFLAACVTARRNILISGGTGSGKTTFLNLLSGYIPKDERIATIEDAAELRLQQPHVVRMETRPANVEGHGEVTSRDLVRNALRMRPDRVVIGESRGPEALDMLQAMNTGHDGSMTTLHANDTRDALSRLEMMVGMAGFDMPMWVIRKQIASAVHIVVQSARLVGGVRKITKISEITGMEGDVISMHDLFVFKQTGLDANRVAQGHFQCTGIRPRCLEHLEVMGAGLPPEMFESRICQFEDA